MIFTIKTPTGRSINLLVPEGNGEASYFVLSVAKAGSTLFNNVVREMCEATDRAHLDVGRQLFPQGLFIEDAPIEMLAVFKQRGIIFNGLRAPWLLMHVSQYRRSTKLLLVRDPRDIAVSWYFSMRYSHPVPTVGLTKSQITRVRKQADQHDISSFILAGYADRIFSHLEIFAEHARRLPGFKVFRYEDIIWSKRDWCADIAKSLAIDLPRERLDAIADKHDIRPVEERPDHHIRQVSPGNFAKHLNRRAVRYVEIRSRAAMQSFGYEPVVSQPERLRRSPERQDF